MTDIFQASPAILEKLEKANEDIHLKTAKELTDSSLQVICKACFQENLVMYKQKENPLLFDLFCTKCEKPVVVGAAFQL